MVRVIVDGQPVEVVDGEASLLEVLREEVGERTVKDGCSPQGQCGCCTVLVDGQPRVACVTPVRRVAGRHVTTLAGLADEVRDGWATAFTAHGASQCGFCSPGIVVRLEGLLGRGRPVDRAAINQALAAHLCRCTGWQGIVEAALEVAAARGLSEVSESDGGPSSSGVSGAPERDWVAAARRATLEGGAPQRVGPEVVLGAGGFADDEAPAGAWVAVPAAGVEEGWALGASLRAARDVAGRVPGRNSTKVPSAPVPVPEGVWELTLQTGFVEPGYLEPDASWCEPGGEPAEVLANGGAFGGKRWSAVRGAARLLAEREGRSVRVLLPREAVVQQGPKRPPVAVGVRGDGTGVLRVARTPGSDLDGFEAAVEAVAPGLAVEPWPVPGPPVSAVLRAAGWAEAVVVGAGLAHLAGAMAGLPEHWPAALVDEVFAEAEPVVVRSPAGVVAAVAVGSTEVRVVVDAGEVLDKVVLRSYCIGAVHQALGWVRTEGLAVGDQGEVLDLTIRSFGILPARSMPRTVVHVVGASGPPVAGGDAVFAAAAAAAWIADGLPPRWPTGAGRANAPTAAAGSPR